MDQKWGKRKRYLKKDSYLILKQYFIKNERHLFLNKDRIVALKKEMKARFYKKMI